MKWTVALMLMAMAGCQIQPKQSPADTQSARAPLPTVLDVTAPAPATTASAPTTVAVEPVATPAAVTQTPSVAPAATAAAGGSNYTVKKGDTLFRIAKEHYGDGKKWQQIAAANPGVTPTSLKVGQTLVMPQ